MTTIPRTDPTPTPLAPDLPTFAPIVGQAERPLASVSTPVIADAPLAAGDGDTDVPASCLDYSKVYYEREALKEKKTGVWCGSCNPPRYVGGGGETGKISDQKKYDELTQVVDALKKECDTESKGKDDLYKEYADEKYYDFDHSKWIIITPMDHKYTLTRIYKSDDGAVYNFHEYYTKLRAGRWGTNGPEETKSSPTPTPTPTPTVRKPSKWDFIDN